MKQQPMPFAIALEAVTASSQLFSIITHFAEDDATRQRLLTDLASVVADVYAATGVANVPKEQFLASMLEAANKIHPQQIAETPEWPELVEDK